MLEEDSSAIATGLQGGLLTSYRKLLNIEKDTIKEAIALCEKEKARRNC